MSARQPFGHIVTGSFAKKARKASPPLFRKDQNKFCWSPSISESFQQRMFVRERASAIVKTANMAIFHHIPDCLPPGASPHCAQCQHSVHHPNNQPASSSRRTEVSSAATFDRANIIGHRFVIIRGIFSISTLVRHRAHSAWQNDFALFLAFVRV